MRIVSGKDEDKGRLKRGEGDGKRVPQDGGKNGREKGRRRIRNRIHRQCRVNDRSIACCTRGN